MKNIELILMSILFAITGELLLKKGMLVIGSISLNIIEIIPNLFKMFTNPYIIAGFFIYGTSAYLWLVVLSRVDLSLAYPMISLGYVLVALMSLILFKENVSLMRWAGIFVICLGVFLISRA